MNPINAARLRRALARNAARLLLASLALCRGTTDGARVIGMGAFGMLNTPVLPGGSFCQETPIEREDANVISVYAVGGDGRLSSPAVVEVAYDPAAQTATLAANLAYEMLSLVALRRSTQ